MKWFSTKIIGSQMINDWRLQKVFINENLSSAYTPCLAYHGIIADSERNPHSYYAVRESQFESQMRYLYDHGYSCLNFIDFFRFSSTGESKPRKVFVLTFDDGLEDFYSRAYPILCRYGFVATNFLVTDLIAKENDCNDETGTPRMTWEQINALSAEGFFFGSHTSSHSHLPHLNNEQIWYELFESKKNIEIRLERDVPYLAYPYGESSPAIREMAMQAGYQAAFGVATGEPGRFNIWRAEIGARDSMQTFIFKLTPWYSYYIKLRGWVRECTAIGQYLRRVKNRYAQASRAVHS